MSPLGYTIVSWIIRNEKGLIGLDLANEGDRAYPCIDDGVEFVVVGR